MIAALMAVALLLPAIDDRPAADGKEAPKLAVEKAPLPEPDEASLLGIRRVYVDRLTGGATAAQIRDLIISALRGSRLFVITENEERADAFLRGAAEDLLYTNKYSNSESTGARGNIAGSESSSTGAAYVHSGISESRAMGSGVNESESVHIEERKHEAMATVRLVNKDGDVIWSTTQESMGGKFRGASADVADRIAKQLTADIDRARKVRRLP